MRFDGKQVVVTGSGKGIGREMALAFAREGADVAINSRTTGDVDSVVEEIRALGRKAIAAPADVGDPDQVREMAVAIHKEFDHVDILINNAGVGMGAVDRSRRMIWDLRLEDWDNVIRINLRSLFLVTQAFVGGMMERRSGSIVNISSGHAHSPVPGFLPYGASKGGLEAFTRKAASDLRECDIAVNSLHPGAMVATDFTSGAPPERRAAMLPGHVMNASTLWLAEQTAETITGRLFDSVKWNEENNITI